MYFLFFLCQNLSPTFGGRRKKKSDRLFYSLLLYTNIKNTMLGFSVDSRLGVKYFVRLHFCDIFSVNTNDV